MKINQPNSDSNEPPGHYSQRRVVVIATGIAAMLLAMSAVWAGWKYLPDVPTQLPIKEVTFSGDIAHTSPEDLQQLARGIRGSLWHTNLADVQAAVKQLPWVRNADVRRRFPDGLQIRIEEHQPVALLKSDEKGDESMLVNSAGEAFSAKVAEANAVKMPVFIGSPASSTVMLLQYQAFQMSLAAIQRQVVEVQLSPRDAWQIKLDNGAVISLGRNDVTQRLQRLLNAWPQVAAMQTPGAHIDLRYNNGFALSGVTLPVKPKNG